MSPGICPSYDAPDPITSSASRPTRASTSYQSDFRSVARAGHPSTASSGGMNAGSSCGGTLPASLRPTVTSSSLIVTSDLAAASTCLSRTVDSQTDSSAGALDQTTRASGSTS